MLSILNSFKNKHCESIRVPIPINLLSIYIKTLLKNFLIVDKVLIKKLSSFKEFLQSFNFNKSSNLSRRSLF